MTSGALASITATRPDRLVTQTLRVIGTYVSRAPCIRILSVKIQGVCQRPDASVILSNAARNTGHCQESTILGTVTTSGRMDLMLTCHPALAVSHANSVLNYDRDILSQTGWIFMG